MTLHGDLLPSAHDTYDIGKTGNRWQNVYASGKFFGNLEGYATDLKVGDSQDNPYSLNVTWAKQASRATNANSADNASKFFNEGGSINGILYANKGVIAKATGKAMWSGWNQVYGVNTGSHGAFHNPTGGAFVGLHNNANIYFGKSLGANNGQYYGWINSGGYYNGSGQRLATEAFVSGNYATKAEAEQSGGITSQQLGANGYIQFSNGLMFQWGHSGRLGGAKVSRTMYFPRSFKSTYSITVTGAATHWDATVNYRYYTDRVWVWLDNFEGVERIDYLAIGTWK